MDRSQVGLQLFVKEQPLLWQCLSYFRVLCPVSAGGSREGRLKSPTFAFECLTQRFSDRVEGRVLESNATCSSSDTFNLLVSGFVLDPKEEVDDILKEE